MEAFGVIGMVTARYLRLERAYVTTCMPWFLLNKANPTNESALREEMGSPGLAPPWQRAQQAGNPYF